MAFRQPPRSPRVRSTPTPVPVEHRRHARMVTPELLAGPVAVDAPARPAAKPKTSAHRDQRIRDSAQHESCLMCLPGCIGHEAGATIWSHFRGSAGGKGGARKADDICGAYACTACDAIYDGQRKPPPGWTRWQIEIAWHEAHIRSLVRLHQKGLL